MPPGPGSWLWHELLQGFSYSISLDKQQGPQATNNIQSWSGVRTGPGSWPVSGPRDDRGQPTAQTRHNWLPWGLPRKVVSP